MMNTAQVYALLFSVLCASLASQVDYKEAGASPLR